MTFSELRCKEVVNVLDGRKLGNISDIVFDLSSACVLGFIVPEGKNGFGFFKNSNQLFIPYCSIVKIGEDAMLVEMTQQGAPANPYILSQNSKK